MNDTQRTRLRLTQDFLLMLAVDMQQLPETLRVAENCPVTLAQLRGLVFPEWEGLLLQQVHALAAELHVGVPDFQQLAEKQH